MKNAGYILCAVVVALAAACGGAPSALDACHKSCDKQGECTNATSLAVFQCKTQCDSTKAQLEDADTLIEHNCNNASSIKQEIYNCYADYCDPSLAQNCAQSAYQVKCDPKF